MTQPRSAQNCCSRMISAWKLEGFVVDDDKASTSGGVQTMHCIGIVQSPTSHCLTDEMNLPGHDAI